MHLAHGKLPPRRTSNAHTVIAVFCTSSIFIPITYAGMFLFAFEQRGNLLVKIMMIDVDLLVMRSTLKYKLCMLGNGEKNFYSCQRRASKNSFWTNWH